MEQTIILLILNVLPTVVGVVIGYLWNKARGLSEKQQAMEKSIRAILKIELRRIYAYGTERGCLSYEDEQIAEEIYETYHALGGNGQGTTMIEAIRKMELRK